MVAVRQSSVELEVLVLPGMPEIPHSHNNRYHRIIRVDAEHTAPRTVAHQSSVQALSLCASRPWCHFMPREIARRSDACLAYYPEIGPNESFATVQRR